MHQDNRPSGENDSTKNLSEKTNPVKPREVKKNPPPPPPPPSSSPGSNSTQGQLLRKKRNKVSPISRVLENLGANHRPIKRDKGILNAYYKPEKEQLPAKDLNLSASHVDSVELLPFSDKLEVVKKTPLPPPPPPPPSSSKKKLLKKLEASRLSTGMNPIRIKGILQVDLNSEKVISDAKIPQDKKQEQLPDKDLKPNSSHVGSAELLLSSDELKVQETPSQPPPLPPEKVISGAETPQPLLAKDLETSVSHVDLAAPLLSSDNIPHEYQKEIKNILETFGNSLEEIKKFTKITLRSDAPIEAYAMAIIEHWVKEDEEEGEESKEEENDENNCNGKSNQLKDENGKDNLESTNLIKAISEVNEDKNNKSDEEEDDEEEDDEDDDNEKEEKKVTTHIVTFDPKNLTREPPEVRDLFEFLSGLDPKILIKKSNEMSLNPDSVEVDQNLILCMAQRLAKVTSTQWLGLAGQGEKLSSLIKPSCSRQEILSIATQLIYQLHISFKSISQLIQKSKTIMPWSLVKELTALNQSQTQEVKNDLLPVLLKNIKDLAFISKNIQDHKEVDVRLVEVVRELEKVGNYDRASSLDLGEELKRLERSLFKIKLKQNPKLLDLTKLMQIKTVSTSNDVLVDLLISAMAGAQELIQIKTFDGIPSRLVDWIEKIIINANTREIPHFFRNLIITMSSKKEIKLDDYSNCINKWASDLIKNSSNIWELAELYKLTVPYDLLDKDKIYKIISTKDLNNLMVAHQYLSTPRKKVEVNSNFLKKLEEIRITNDDKTSIQKYKVVSLADKIQKSRIDGMLAHLSETEILELAQELRIQTPQEGSSPLSKTIITKVIENIIQDIEGRVEDNAQDESSFISLFKEATKLHICKDKDFVYSSELAQNNSYYVLLLIMTYISLLGSKEDLQEEFDFNFTYLMDNLSDLEQFAKFLTLSFNLSSIDQINRAGLACRILFKLNAEDLFTEKNIQHLKETGCDDGFEELPIVLILNQVKEAAAALEEDDEDEEEKDNDNDNEQKGQSKQEDENENEEEVQRTPSELKQSVSLKEDKYEINKENKISATKPKLLPRQLFMVTTSSENLNLKKIMADYTKDLLVIINSYNDSMSTRFKSFVGRKKTANRSKAIRDCAQSILQLADIAEIKTELKLIPILNHTEEIFTTFDNSVSNSTASTNPQRQKLADFFSCYILKLINESQLSPEIKSFLVNHFPVINLLWQDRQLCYQFRDGEKVRELRRDLIFLASRYTATTSNTMAFTQTARKIWLETVLLFAQMHAKVSLASTKNLETAKQILVKISEEIEIYDRDFKQGTASERPKWVQCFTQCLKSFIPCSQLPGPIKKMLVKEMNSILKLVDPQFSTRNISVSKKLRDELIQLIFKPVPSEDIGVRASVNVIDFNTILFEITQIEATTSSDQSRLLTPRTPRSSPSPSHSSTLTNGKSSPSS